MSHDSGFRQGAQDFTHKAKAKSSRRGRSSERFDKQMDDRFHQHERKADEIPPTQDKATST